jgi:hypothetical protein
MPSNASDNKPDVIDFYPAETEGGFSLEAAEPKPPPSAAGRKKSIGIASRGYTEEALDVVLEIMRKKDAKDSDRKDCALAILQYGHGRPGTREAPKTDDKPIIKVQ